MSNNLKIYKPLDLNSPRESEMHITAFVGGEVHGKCIQFTIGESFTCLNEKALNDLVQTIQKRINGQDGYLATDSCRNEVYTQEVSNHTDES